MKKLLALLATLFLGPALAQEVVLVPGPYVPPPIETPNLIYTTLNSAPEGTQFQWSGFIPTQSNGGGLSGGNIPGYNTFTGTFLFGYAQGNINYNLSNSSEWPNGNGFEVNGFKYSFEYFNQDFSRGTLSVGITFRAPNQSVLESFGLNLPQTINGWTTVEGIYAFSHPYDRPDIGSIQFTLSGKDDRFWAGYYGPQIRDLDLSVLYNPVPPPPPGFLYWTSLAGEWGTFTLTETTTVRYGGEGTYIYATLEAGTYACNNFEWGRDPAGGIGKSCEAGTNTDPNPPQTDCTLYPTDPNCAVLVYTDPELIADAIVDEIVADATTTDTTDETQNGSDDGSDDGSELIEEDEDTEEVMVASDAADETDLEEMLADEETTDEETPAETTQKEVTYRELTDEEKAALLADAISKSAIESALAISSATSTTTTNTENVSNTSRTTTTNTMNEEENKQVAEINKQDTQSESAESGLEIFENGRSVGQAALANILSSSADSANEANNQTETQNLGVSTQDIVAKSLINEDAILEVTAFSQEQETIEQSTMEAIVENVNNDFTNNGLDMFVTEDGRPKDMFGQSNSSDVEIETLALLEMIKQSSNTDDDKQFEDTITVPAFDPNNPALSNIPNVSNLEMLGVLNNKQEEKSDAEKRAEAVTAANKEQQDEINKNYMDADQSGIVAAIGADTDVSSYRSAMLNDNNVWYKPEDIYKNVVYKDNVRGAYFLEKGNTDTYKKMVEEQYK